MCFCYGGPPYGIPIEEETHELLPQPVKDAYEIFRIWWRTVHLSDGITPIDEASMPADVREAYDLILETPIPGYDNATCADSCAMIIVQACFNLFLRVRIFKNRL